MASTVRNNVTTVGSNEDNRYKDLHSQKGEVNPGSSSSDAALASKKINSDPHLSNVLGKLDRVRGDTRDGDPAVSQGQLNKGKLANDPSKIESSKAAQEQFQINRDLASGLSKLAHDGIPKTEAKTPANGQDAQMAFQQGHKGAQANNQRAHINPNQQNTAAMAQGLQAGKPLVDPGLKQPIANNTAKPLEAELKNGARVSQQDAVKQAKGAESGRTTLAGEQAGKQLTNLQAGQAAASANIGAEKIKQQDLRTADNIEEPEKTKDEDRTEDTPESSHTQMAGQAKKFKEMALAGGMGGGVGGEAGGNGSSAPSFEIAAKKIGEVHEDQVTHLEKTGADLGFRVISPTVDELQSTEAKLTSVKFGQEVLKPVKERLTLDEVIKFNQPNQELVKLIIADTQDAMEEARKLLNTGRTNAYGMMSA